MPMATFVVSNCSSTTISLDLRFDHAVFGLMVGAEHFTEQFHLPRCPQSIRVVTFQAQHGRLFAELQSAIHGEAWQRPRDSAGVLDSLRMFETDMKTGSYNHKHHATSGQPEILRQ